MRRRPLAVVLAALIAAAAIAWAILAHPGSKSAGASPPAPFVPSLVALAQRPSATAAKAPHVALRPAPAKARRLRMLMDHLPAPPRGELRVVASIAPQPTTTTVPVSDATSTDTRDWSCIRWYESTDDYAAPGGGAYQFEDFVWTEFSGLPAPAEDYSPALQDATALKLYAYDLRVWGDGFEAWTTRYVCGL